MSRVEHDRTQRAMLELARRRIAELEEAVMTTPPTDAAIAREIEKARATCDEIFGRTHSKPEPCVICLDVAKALATVRAEGVAEERERCKRIAETWGFTTSEGQVSADQVAEQVFAVTDAIANAIASGQG